MKCIKAVISLLFVLIFIPTISAQENSDDQLSLDSSNINDQFEYLLEKSGNFKGLSGQPYKAVKLSMFLTLQKHTNDTLRVIREDLAKVKATVDTQANEISNLKSNLETTQTTLDKTRKEKDSMALFGMQMSKSGYNVLMWGIIGLLLAMLIFFIFKYKSSNSITKQAKKALSEIEEEFEEHRKTALEREQKVRRQLQDEINKQKSDN